mgnify:FL=1
MYIRRTISILASAISIGICVFITYISRDVDLSTILFNLSFLGVMLIMIGAAYAIGLRRLIQTGNGLKRATEALKNAGDDLDTGSIV